MKLKALGLAIIAIFLLIAVPTLTGPQGMLAADVVQPPAFGPKAVIVLSAGFIWKIREI